MYTFLKTRHLLFYLNSIYLNSIYIIFQQSWFLNIFKPDTYRKTVPFHSSQVYCSSVSFQKVSHLASLCDYGLWAPCNLQPSLLPLALGCSGPEQAPETPSLGEFPSQRSQLCNQGEKLSSSTSSCYECLFLRKVFLHYPISHSYPLLHHPGLFSSPELI